MLLVACNYLTGQRWLFIDSWLYLRRVKLAADLFHATAVFTRVRIPLSRSGSDIYDLPNPVQQKFSIVNKKSRTQLSPTLLKRADKVVD